MSSEISARILALVADVLELKRSEVTNHSHLFQDLGASSLDIAEMIWRIEDDKAFGVGEIPDEILESVETVGDVVTYIEQRVRGTLLPSVKAGEGKIALGADHFGQAMTLLLEHHLERQGEFIVCLGVEGARHISYPEIAEAIGHMVSKQEVEFGVLVGDDGVGMSIVANKIDGVRAALVNHPHGAKQARKRHNANILCLGASNLGEGLARACVEAFLSTSFDAGEDGRRLHLINRIHEIEKHSGPK
jgi:ribose 5-phosphate isomerase B